MEQQEQIRLQRHLFFFVCLFVLFCFLATELLTQLTLPPVDLVPKEYIWNVG